MSLISELLRLGITNATLVQMRRDLLAAIQSNTASLIASWTSIRPRRLQPERRDAYRQAIGMQSDIAIRRAVRRVAVRNRVQALGMRGAPSRRMGEPPRDEATITREASEREIEDIVSGRVQIAPGWR